MIPVRPGGYFAQKDWISNSEFTKLMRRAGYGVDEPQNLDRIFEFGILFEDLLLQPRKANLDDPDLELAKEMVLTARRDIMLYRMMSMPDFRVQHEFYRHDVYGLMGRCKTDGDSRMLQIMLELKGLAVSTENEFREAIDHFNYDRAAAWYINCTHIPRQLIVGVSKKAPDRIFKQLITKDDAIYKEGERKIVTVKRVIHALVGDLSLDQIAA